MRPSWSSSAVCYVELDDELEKGLLEAPCLERVESLVVALVRSGSAALGTSEMVEQSETNMTWA